jgi:pyruvate dehydrogenase E1 component alpha subunit
MADIYSFFFRGYETWDDAATDEEGYPDPPEDNRRLPETTALGTQLPQSVGLIWGRKYQGRDEVGLVYHGDGSTSTGDFHEGLNFAGVFDIPVVFLCENNGWAISVPRERQTASETIAQRATGYGFEGQIVDGNDALAVYAATTEALKKARSDHEPTLIEDLTYRRGAHTTSDDPSVYRDEEEVAFWEERDPIDRYEAFLEDQGLWDEGYAEDIRATAKEEAHEAAQEALERVEQQTYEEIFDEVYDEPTLRLAEQQAELEALLEEYGETAFREE